MAVNIGPRIGIDGEKEYRKQINDLINQQKTFSAEMRELESSFDETTSAMEKNRKKSELLTKQIANQEKQVDELEKGLEAAKDKYGDNAAETNKWKQAVSNAKTELNKMRKELDKVPKPLSEIGKGMQNAGKKMQTIGSTMTKYVTAPLTALGAASVAAWKEVDDGLDTVVKKTGATGAALESLQESVSVVATSIPTSFAEAGSAIGAVNTKFGLTGQALEGLTTNFIKFAQVNDQDVSSAVTNTQKVMAAFGVDTKDAGKLLDAMTKSGQQTGVSMDTLQTSMVKNATALQSMGLNAYDAAGFLGQVETSGADTSQVMSGLSKALINAADDGKTLPEALSEFQGIMSSTASEQEKLTAATDLFGKKAGPAIYNACKEGSLNFENLASDASQYLGTVQQTFDNIVDPADNFQIALNKVKEAGSQIGGTLLEIAAPAIEDLGDAAKDAGEWFNGLSEGEQDTVVKALLVAAAAGPTIKAIGTVTEGVGKAVVKFGSLAEKLGAVPGLASAITSPVGLAALAIGGMAAAFALLDKDSGFANEKVQTLVDNTSEAVSNLDSATQGLTDTLAESEQALSAINDKSNLAQDLINELAELESQSELTREEQARMSQIVGELNSLYPDLALEIDASTGKLNMSTEAIRKHVAQAKKMSLLEAYTKAAKDGYDKLAEAHLKLVKAKQQVTANEKTLLGLETQRNNLDVMGAEKQKAMGVDAYSQALQTATDDLTVAEERQAGLKTAVDEAQAAYDEAEGTIRGYEAEAEKLAASMDTSAKSQESSKKATESATEAFVDEETAAENAAEAVDKLNAAGNALTEGMASTASEIWDSTVGIAKAYDETYQAAYDSISGQIGLFDEWTESFEGSMSDLLKAQKSQIEGLKRYNSNMEKLSKAAAESNNENFKAFVKALNEAGPAAAGEVDTLVRAMESGSEEWNEYVAGLDPLETLKEESAANGAYIANDFKTKGEAVSKGWNDAMAKINPKATFNSLVSAAQQAAKSANKSADTMGSHSANVSRIVEQNYKKGFNTVPTTAQAATQLAVSNTTRDINGMNLNPSVKKVSVPTPVTSEAKSTIQQRLDNVVGRLEKINGASAAASEAKTTASQGLQGIKGTMEITNAESAAQKARNAIQQLFNNNPITSIIKTITQKSSSGETGYATGGIVDNEQMAWIAEGNKAEAIIPLQANRARALSLYEETGRILGAAPSFTLGQTTRISAPGSQTVDLNVDTESLYRTVAAGAERGMQSANIRVYVSGREAGRILKDMGVQFA